MNARFHWLLLGLLLFAADIHASRNLVTNASFESGFTGWSNFGTAVRTIGSPGHAGTNSLRLTGRAALADGAMQDVTTLVKAGGSGSNYTVRAWMKLDSAASVRIRLQMLDSSGSVTNLLFAERMITTTNQWIRVAGVQKVNWIGTLSTARLKFEGGLMVEGIYTAFNLDDVLLELDSDGDGLTDSEEAVLGTNPSLADTDLDGLPDGWEVDHGLNPRDGLDATSDLDKDTFTAKQEYWAATDPADAASFPAAPSYNAMSEPAQALLRMLALAPVGTSNRAFLGQTISSSTSVGGSLVEYTNFVAQMATVHGRWPALLCVQYENTGTPGFAIATMNPIALQYATNGGLVMVHYAPANPWNGGVANNTNGLRDLTQLVVPGTAAYTNWIAGLDGVAAGLTAFRDAGIPVLFKTLHEQNGAWFWWGRRPRADYIGLWRHMHDYLTINKGLTNLLWVHQGADGPHDVVPADYYYPGNDVVDVAAHDVYSDTWTYNWSFDALYRNYPKPHAFSEAGPDSGPNGQWQGNWDTTVITSSLRARYPRCSLFCAWSSFINGAQYKHLALMENLNVAAMLSDPWIATREAADWKSFMTPRVSAGKSGAALQVDWQGGALEKSVDLIHWTEIIGAPRPAQEDTTTDTMRFYRVRRGY